MKTRNARLIERCRLYMSAGSWWTIKEMAKSLACSECTASARIRDLRKEKYGGHKIVKRLRPGGFYQYRMIAEKAVSA